MGIRRKKIPPPLEPVLEKPMEIQLPFVLAEQLRVFLDYLAHSEKIPEDQRLLISEWLGGYSAVLTWHLMQTYGILGLSIASAQAEQVYNAFYKVVGEGMNEHEQDLFKFWEGDINGRPDDSSQAQ